jgi:hypothetical protein
VNIPRERRELLNDIAKVLKVAFDKYENDRTKNSERQSWGRLIIGGVAAAGDVMKDVDLDDLKTRIEKLEEVKKNGAD